MQQPTLIQTILQELNPKNDLTSLAGNTLDVVVPVKASAKSLLRGASTGAVLGYGLGSLAYYLAGDSPQVGGEAGATIGAIVLGSFDAVQYGIRSTIYITDN